MFGVLGNCFPEERNYYAFILAYDLLHDYFASSNAPECDCVYVESDALAAEFMESDEYRDKKLSTYDALRAWADRFMEELSAIEAVHGDVKEEK